MGGAPEMVRAAARGPARVGGGAAEVAVGPTADIGAK